MPELPETEVVVRQLRAACLGATVDRLDIFHPALLGKETDLDPGWCAGCRIEAVQRHGKHMIVRLSKGGETGALVLRLGMTGQLVMRDPKMASPAHTHFHILLKDRSFRLDYRDPRRFGRLYLIRDPDPLLKGKDPLKGSLKQMLRILRGRRGRLKPALMNQGLIAGIGNIYANEILFEAGLHPNRQVDGLSGRELDRLFRAVRAVLRRGISKGGATIRDFRSLNGTPGEFQNVLRVYGRAGKPCDRPGCCGTVRLIRSTPLGQPSFFCASCQRMKRWGGLSPRRDPGPFR